MLEKDENIDMKIRIAKLKDVAELSILGKKTFDQSFGHLYKDRMNVINYLNSTFSIEKIKSSISDSQHIYWIVFYKEIAVGYAKIQLNAPSKFIESTQVCKLQRLYILQEYLSKGIGGQLLKLICDKVKVNKGQYIWLSVLKSNKKAIHFYERYKYQIIGEHSSVVGKENFNFWVMRIRL